MPEHLPIGIIRCLQTASSRQGIFKILAIDHWDSMRELICPENPLGVSAAELTDLKLQIIQHVGSRATAVIVDPVYSAAQAVATGVLPGQVGFLSKVEQEAFVGLPHERHTELIDDWDAAKAKRLGACGVKLFLYYHPLSGELAERQEKLASHVALECAEAEIPFFLEPIVYSIDPAIPTESREFAARRRELVIESARRMAKLQPTVLKLQFPIDGNHEKDESVWRDACTELDSVTPVPWAILSAGDPFEVFKTQLQVACEAGCSGFLAGRALWREAAPLRGADRLAALDQVVLPRLEELNDIAERYGKSWMSKLPTQTVSSDWYRGGPEASRIP